MARVLFVAILAMCLVAMLQGSPVVDEVTRNPITDMQNAWQAATTTLQQGFNNLANDPTVVKFKEDMARLLAQGAEAIRAEAEKAIPQTQ